MDTHEVLIKLGTFPVTQQIAGVAFLAYSLAKAVAEIAKIAFYSIKKSFANDIKDQFRWQMHIDNTKRDLKSTGEDMLAAGIMIIPVLGSIFCGLMWYQNAQMQKRVRMV